VNGASSARDGPPGAGVLENDPWLVSRFSERWRQKPRWWRRAVAVSALLLFVVPATLFGASLGRAWLIERGLRDEVSLVGTVHVLATSTTPLGGSVNYNVAVRNTGARPVQITGVDISQSRLHITDKSPSPLRLAAGETGEVAVSVRLDCTRGGPFDPRDGLRGEVVAIARSGTQHRVYIAFEQGFLLTDVANTLCRVRPGLTDEELSGPVLGQ
jgi:hypothetical protein